MPPLAMPVDRDDFRVEGDWDAAMDTSWRSSFDAEHVNEDLHPATRFDSAAAREARIQALQRRVDEELGRVGKPPCHRGKRRPVVCTTLTVAGGNPIWRSVTDACHWLSETTGNRRAVDRMCQAINRGRPYGGHRWGYLDQLRGDTEATKALPGSTGIFHRKAEVGEQLILLAVPERPKRPRVLVAGHAAPPPVETPQLLLWT